MALGVGAKLNSTSMLFALALVRCSNESAAPISTSEDTPTVSAQGSEGPRAPVSDSSSSAFSSETAAATSDSPTSDSPTSDPVSRSTDETSAAVSPSPVQPGDSLSARYPGDMGIAGDDAVLFFDDFENGWGRWDGPNADTDYLRLETDAASAHGGASYLRSSVTSADLEAEEYISSQAYVTFGTRTPLLYTRFYAQFVGTAPAPHHWVRLTAGTPEFNGSGRANTVPPGDQGFWFDFDVNTDDVFNFYVYWHAMRSGRCNDGSTEPGCEGDQGTTYHYGNVFRPPDQTPLARDNWFCIEIRSKANTVGDHDGELQFWVNDVLVGDYRPGFPDGTWLRDSFHTGGCTFSACTEPVPFEGFDFRTAEDVLFKGFHLDAYYERQSSADKREVLREKGINVDDAQTILYDDVVVATERIGCKR